MNSLANDILVRTLQFFRKNPQGFTQDTLARDKNGQTVHPSSDKAVCWCGVGRIAKEAGLSESVDSAKAYDLVEKLFNVDVAEGVDVTKGEIVTANDEEGRAALIAVLERAVN